MATGGAGPEPRHPRAAGSGRRLVAPLIGGIVIGLLAFAYVVYTLWPRWPAAPATASAPQLPIIIGDETFQVPSAAIRKAVQRHPGPQDRIDLVYTWPGLVPPPTVPALKKGRSGITLQEGRLFVSIMPTESPTDPVERFRTIYLRYTANNHEPAPEGLVIVAFRADSPYQGEDLAYDERAPERFIVRCARSEHKLAPATCLYERYAGNANITIRFPRELLSDWRALAEGFDRLIADLHPQPATQ